MRRALLVAGLAVFLSSCSHVGTVRARASFELACPKDEVVVTDGLEASGCGRAASYSCVTQRMDSACVSATGAPPAPADRDPPRGVTPGGAALNRAVIDLSCPEDQLKVVGLSGRHSYGVKGCGRRIAYVCSSFMWSWGCKADSPIYPW